MIGTWILAGLFLSPALGAETPASLGQAIPADHFFYLRSRENPERRFLAPALAELKRAVEEARLPEALLGTLADGYRGPERKAFLEEALHWRRALGGVAWDDLFSRECVLGARFDLDWSSPRALDPSPRLEWISLFRVDPARRDGHLVSLREVALALGTLKVEDELTGRMEGFEVIDTSRGGIPTVVLSLPDGDTRLCVSGQEDVVAASRSAVELRRAFKLLRGEGSGRALVEDDGFRGLLAAVTGTQAGPAGQDCEILLRPGLILEEIRAALKAVEDARLPAELREKAEALIRDFGALVDTFDLVKSAAYSGTTAGRRILGSFRIDLADDAPKRALYPALVDRPPVEDFARLVPDQACGFLVTSGCDLPRLHDALAEFVERLVPEGGKILEEYRRWQQRSGFDLKRDLLSLIEGQLVLLSFPAPAGGWVLLLRLKDPARAEAELDRWLGKGSEGLKAVGMGPERVEIADVPGVFRRVALPMPAGLEITFGISGDLFALGTRRERLREGLLVRSGKTGNILKNPGWSGLGLKPPSAVQAISYRDLGGLWNDLQTGVQALPLLAALIPDEAAGVPPLGKRLLLLGPRLAPVIRALAFLEQGGGYLVRDGQGLRGEIAVTVTPTPPPRGRESQKPVDTKRKY